MDCMVTVGRQVQQVGSILETKLFQEGQQILLVKQQAKHYFKQATSLRTYALFQAFLYLFWHHIAKDAKFFLLQLSVSWNPDATVIEQQNELRIRT